MSEAKHTPGPWAVGQYTPTPHFASIKNHACVCDPRTLALIATCGRADDRQSQADADLIAAAPDLLAACEVTIPIVLNGLYFNEDYPSAVFALAALRAAVAKAKGGQP